jgi:hypothetical protein
MLASRVSKSSKSSKLLKPACSWCKCYLELAELISSDPENVAMVACSMCVKNNVVCYYDREQSISYMECL